MEQFKPMNFTQPGNMRAAMKTGKTLLGVGVSFPSVETAKKVAYTGYDWAFIDGEHAPFTPVLLADIIHNLNFHSQGKTMSVVRVPSHEPSFISTALDAGAAGIVLPHTETREQVNELINNCRFPPLGKRSYPPWAWIPGINNQTPDGVALSDYMNDRVAVIAQIESAKGVENAEEIVSAPGVDGVMIGVGDLRMDMNLPLDWDAKEPEFIAAINKVEGLAKKYGKTLVGFAFPEMTAMWEDRIRRGYQLLMCAADSYTMTYGLAMTNGSARKSIAEIQATMAKEQEEKAVAVNGNGHAAEKEVANGA